MRSGYASIIDYGATSAAADSAPQIQAALDNNATVIVPPGVWNLTAAPYGIKLNSNNTLILAPGAELHLNPTANGSYQVILIRDVGNAHVVGHGRIVGDLAAHPGQDGEHGHGVAFLAASACSVSGATIEGCWGDSVYVGGPAPSVGTQIIDVGCVDSRRNGISVVNADQTTIADTVITGSGRVRGAYPMAGVDLEPNALDAATNTTLIRVTATDCGQEGFIIQAPFSVESGGQGGPTTAELINCIAEDNGAAGFSVKESGRAVLDRCSAIGNQGAGIHLPGPVGGRTGLGRVAMQGGFVAGNKGNGIEVWTRDNLFQGVDLYGNERFNVEMREATPVSIAASNSFIGCSFRPDPQRTNRNIVLRNGSVDTRFVGCEAATLGSSGTSFTDQTNGNYRAAGNLGIPNR